MPRTAGSKDIEKRKRRIDKGRKRKKYRGREIIRFPKRKGNKEAIKIWFWERKRMSKQGYSKWSRHVRRFIRPVVYHFGIRVDVPINMISTKEAIEELALEVIGYDGHFLAMGVSGSPKTKTGLKWVKLFEVVIMETRDGLRARMIKDHRLYRYWFWRGN